MPEAGATSQTIPTTMTSKKITFPMYKAGVCSNPSVEKNDESKEELKISDFSDLNMQESASIMNKVTANFPERFLDWSDEQRKIAYDYNFKLYMEKFLDTIPSFTAH